MPSQLHNPLLTSSATNTKQPRLLGQEEKASVIEVLQNLRKLALNATFDSLDPAGNGLR